MIGLIPACKIPLPTTLGGMKIVYDEASQMYIRSNANDETSVSNVSCRHAMNVGSNDTILDLGANVGSFTRYCMQRGARMVTAVEADSETFVLLKLNSESWYNHVECLNVAIYGYGNSARLRPFYISRHNRIASTTMNGKHGVVVPAIDFGTILESRNYSIVKMDIEGAEHTVDFCSLSTSHGINVRAISIDYHVFGNPEWLASCHQIHDSLCRMGFKSTRTFKRDIKGTSEFCYLRN